MLVQNAASDQYQIRLASIQTLGFIVEEVRPEDISPDQMNYVLSALLTNITESNPIELVRMAVKAFARAAPITNRNFQD
jgi:hypothetical protein